MMRETFIPRKIRSGIPFFAGNCKVRRGRCTSIPNACRECINDRLPELIATREVQINSEVANEMERYLSSNTAISIDLQDTIRFWVSRLRMQTNKVATNEAQTDDQSGDSGSIAQ